MSLPRTLKRVALAAFGLASGVLTWSLIEARAYVLREYDVPILPPGADPVRILHISDLHLLPGDRHRIEWVRALAAYAPDVVVTTGDNLAHERAVPAVLDALSPFLHVPGAFVTGSNDFYAPVMKNPFKYFFDRDVTAPAPTQTLPGDALIRSLIAAGWHHLDNDRARLDVNGLHLELVGTGDAHVDRARMPEPAPAANGRAVDVALGLTHAPYAWVLDALADEGVALTMAGHTHGGQVCVPGYGALVTNCDLDRERASGLHRWNRRSPAVDPMWLHVSAGLGTSPFTPVRLACRPEASLLTLIPADSR